MIARSCAAVSALGWMFLVLAMPVQAQQFIPDGFLWDGYDYPVGHRGYDDESHPQPMPEHVPQGAPEAFNSIYPDFVAPIPYSPPKRERLEDGRLAGAWYLRQDTGNYLAARNGLHPGEDWNYGQNANSDVGQPVFAAANGRVEEIRNVEDLGYLILIRHFYSDHRDEDGGLDDFDYTLYLHVAPPCVGAGNERRINSGGLVRNEFDIAPGDWVRRGERIAVIANIASGPHLHFELRNGAEYHHREVTYPNDNGQGYYGNDTQGMDSGEVEGALGHMSDDGILDPSDFFDGADLAAGADRRPLLESVLVNGGLSVFGGTLENPDIFLRILLNGSADRFLRPGIEYSNFKISGMMGNGAYGEISDPEDGAPVFVADSFQPHSANEYSFRLRVTPEAVADLEQGRSYGLGFDINSVNGAGDVVSVRAFAADLYFLDADYFSDVPDLAQANCSGDVVAENWYVCYLYEAVSSGLIRGSDNVFRPEHELTRGEMAVVVSNLMFQRTKEDEVGFVLDSAGLVLPGAVDDGEYFLDVPPCHPFFDYVQTLRNRGVVQGLSAEGQLLNRFAPDEPVSRAELAKFILGALDIAPDPLAVNPFSDVPDEWYQPYVATITATRTRLGEALVSGYPTTPRTFQPTAAVSRAEAAKFVLNASRVESNNAFRRATESWVGELFEQVPDESNLRGPGLIELPGGNQQSVSAPLTINGEATDQDGDDLFYFWSVDGGSLTTADPTSHRSVIWSPPSLVSTTTFTVVATAGDRRGKITRSEFRFTVQGNGTPNTPPTISVTAPSQMGEVATTSYVVRWTDDDPDSDATISLSYDDNDSGNDGTPIAGASGLPESSGVDQFTWDTSSVAPGAYYVHAAIDDGVNAPAHAYSSGTVRVESGSGQPADPLNWRLVEYAPGNNYQGIGYDGGTYVAVGRETAISLSGDEGLTWGHLESSVLPDDFHLHDAHHANGRWILVGEEGIGGRLMYTDHLNPGGSTHSFVLPTVWYGDVLHDIHYADGKWVAVGEPSLVIFSTNNGATWTEGSISGSGYSFDFQAVDYDASTDTWIAVSDSTTPRSQVATSNDGIHWQQRDVTLASTYRLQGVAAHGGLTVAVGFKTVSGAHEVILTSSNGGATWTDHSSGARALFDVVYRPEGWVAVGDRAVAVSESGTTWETHEGNLGRTMRAVAYAPDEDNLVAVDHSQIHRAQTVGGATHRLVQITVEGGSGTVDGLAFTSCRDYCVTSYTEGSVLQLTAEPDSGFLFREWIGGSCDGVESNVCDLVVTENETIDANFEVDDPPTISILEPDGVLDKTRDSFTIRWTDSDPDSNATIQFFRDQNADGVGGTLINASVIFEDDENDRYFWDTRELPEGDYYVYAIINDGNATQTAVSGGPITIIHNTPPSLTILEPDGAGDTEDLTFDLVWTDDDPDNDASIDFFYDTDSSGADGVPIPEAQDISEDDDTNSLQWDVSGLPEQDFYVYGIIDDGVMDPVTAYSPGPLSILHVSTNIPPTLSFLQPDGVDDSADLEFTIAWTDEDPDNDADIFLFYDTDGFGVDGLPINGTALSEDDETDQFVWDTSAVENGSYFIYAIIDDHVRPAVTIYSASPVLVAHGNALPALTLHQPGPASAGADQSFTITWSDEDPDNDASIALYYDTDNTGSDGILIVDGLSEDDETDSYLWTTKGLRADDYFVYAIVDDGEHTPPVVYSDGPVSVNHPGYRPAWTEQFGTTAREWAESVAVDSAGNSYMTGFFRADMQVGGTTLIHNDLRDAFLIKLNPGGEIVWAKTFGGEDDDYGMDLAVDGSDNVYVTGYFENLMHFDAIILTAVGSTDVYVAKLDSAGVVQWAKRFGESGYSEALSIDVSSAGEAYFTGTFSEQMLLGSMLTAVGRADVFVGKLGSQGSVLWGRQGGGPSTWADEGYGISVDESGNAYVTGQFMRTATFGGQSITATTINNPDIFVVRYNSNGTVQWVQSAGGVLFDRGLDIAASADGYVYATGFFEKDASFDGTVLSTGNRPDAFLAKYSANSGALSWVRHGQSPSDERGYGVVVTPANEIAMAGDFNSSVLFEDARIDGRGVFLVLYRADGSLKWARPILTSGDTGSSQGNAVASDASSDLRVAGFFSGSIDVDRSRYNSQGDFDVFLVNVDQEDSSNAAPTLTLVEPDGVDDTVADQFIVTWIDEDLDNDAQILLFVDDDNQDFDGALLTPTALSEDDETDQWTWDVSSLTAGNYYIYASISDGVNPTMRGYAAGPVTVDPIVATLSVSASPSTLPEPGGTVTISVRVTNESPLEPLTVSILTGDSISLNGLGDCVVPFDVEPASLYECSYPTSVSGGAGTSVQLDYSMQWQAGERVGTLETSTAVTTSDVLPTVTVSKTSASASLPEPGDLVTFTVRVDNTSIAETVTLDSLVDDVHGDLNGQGTCAAGGTIGTLSFYECSYGAMVDGNAGDSEISTTIATASDDDGHTVQAQGSSTVTLTDVQPTISLAKTAESTSVDEPGGEVTFKVRVDNTGTAEDIILTALDDDRHGDLAGQGSCTVPQTVAIGAFYQCSYAVVVNGNGGDIETSTTTASANDDDGNTVQAQGSAAVTVNDVLPAISVTKTATPAMVDEPGGDVTLTVRVDNLGMVEEVTLTTLENDLHGNLAARGSCVLPQTITAGTFYQCSYSDVVNGNAGDMETSTTTASARDDDGNATQALDSATVTLTDVLPAISLVMTATPATIGEPGGDVTLTVRVDNTGMVEEVSLVSLDNDLYGDLAGQGTCTLPQSIAAGTFYQCSYAVVISGNAGDTETSTTTANANDDEGNTVQAQDSASVTLTDQLPMIHLEKSVVPDAVPAPGGEITFTVRVDNTSAAEPVTLDALFDDVHGDLNGRGTCTTDVVITALASYECAYDAMISGNVGDSETSTTIATVSDDDGNTAQVQDSATVTLTDEVPPTVAGVATLAGPLAVCDSVPTPTTRFEITFEDDHSSIQGVGDPSNYLLVTAGPDGDFSTLACGGAVDDDLELPLTGASILTGTSTTVIVEVEVGTILRAGLYRLLVCDAITDAAGNALDGDGDLLAGGNFVVAFFRIDPANLFVNGSFDDCPVTFDPWLPISLDPNVALIGQPRIDDTEGSPLSASARFLHSTSDPSSLEQCLPMTEGDYDFAGRLRLDAPDGTVVDFSPSCSFFDGSFCTGSTLDSTTTTLSLAGSVNWIQFTDRLDAPVGTVSALCSVTAQTSAGISDFDLAVDALILRAIGTVFTDGFESGDTSAWSSSVP